MVPAYLPGDHVLVLRKTVYKKGEVVVLKKEGKNYVKRIKKNSESECLVGGDNKKESVGEFLVKKKDIIGKVILKY